MANLRTSSRALVVLALAVLSVLVGVTAPATAAPTRLPVAEARLLNYYPATHGWTKMWTAWDGAELDRDMATARSLGANAIRLIVHPQAFGFPTPSPVMQQRLASAVDIAGRHGLAVQLTLFDWFSAYQDVRGSKEWATAVVGPFRDDPRVFSVELQNELPVENPLAVSWAKALLPHLGSIAPIPTTVSVNGRPARLAALAKGLGDVRPSFWSYHYYDQVLGNGANAAFAAAKAAAAPLQLFIGETGTDTLPRRGETPAAAEARQDHFLRAAFAAAAANGLPAPAPWTLFDFAPGTVPGRPWEPQHWFGLHRTDGTAKPAAATVRQAFRTGTVSTGFNGSFESAPSPVPAEWSLYLGDQATIALDTTVARAGRASLRISASKGSPTGWPSAWTTPVLPLAPGRAYTARAWAKGRDATGTTRLGISWYDAELRYLGTTPSNAVRTGTSDWQELTATAVPPRDAAIVALHLQSTRNDGTVWFDEVTFG